MEECISCVMVENIIEALDGHAEKVFEQFATSIITLGSAFTSFILVGIYMLRTQFGLENQMGPEATYRFFGNIGRLALCLAIVSSFAFWKDTVVGMMEDLTSFTTGAILNVKTDELPPIVDPKYLGLASIEFVIFDPLNRTVEGITSRGLLSSITNLHLIIGVLVLYMSGIVGIVLVVLYYIEFEFWKFIFTAFAPLIIFAWVFEATRGAAWAAAKVFLQSVLTLMLVAGVASIIQAIFEPISDAAPERVEGQLFIRADQFDDFLTGSQFVGIWAAEGVANLLLLFVKIIAILVVFGGIPSLRARGQ